MDSKSIVRRRGGSRSVCWNIPEHSRSSAGEARQPGSRPFSIKGSAAQEGKHTFIHAGLIRDSSSGPAAWLL